MLRVLSQKEADESRRANFSLAEPGFLVRTKSLGPYGKQYKLVVTKEETNGTLEVIALTQDTILKIVRGEAISLATETIGMSDLHDVMPTAVTDDMCRERDGLRAHCRDCEQLVCTHPGTGNRNYRVGDDGLARHIDCAEPSRFTLAK